MTRNFRDMLEAKWAESKFVCVGLDSEYDRIPECIRKGSNAGASMLAFNEKIIDATHDLVCAYKPNKAFYVAFGATGLEVFKRTVAHIRQVAPDVLVIDDSKYGDIGNTNQGYVVSTFGDIMADAVTISPYPGGADLGPFLTREDKGIIVLCRMSTPGAAEFQDMQVAFCDKMPRRDFEQLVGSEIPESGVPLYQYVAYRVTRHWNERGNCGLVVGATCPDEMAAVRRINDDIPVLMPGFGRQGGVIEQAIRAGKGRKSPALLPSNSSSLIFASAGDDFAEAARRKTMEFGEQLRSHF